MQPSIIPKGHVKSIGEKKATNLERNQFLEPCAFQERPAEFGKHGKFLSPLFFLTGLATELVKVAVAVILFFFTETSKVELLTQKLNASTDGIRFPFSALPLLWYYVCLHGIETPTIL
jgi:hypothetical protein